MWQLSRRLCLSIAVFVALFAAVPVLAGPPWISVEYPTNPHHPSMRGAAFLVRVYHHTTAIEASVTGRVEGVVDGRRRSVPLQIDGTVTPGVYAVRGVPRDPGAWVAVITMSYVGGSSASALITLDPDGGVTAVEVPSTETADGWLVPRALTDRDVEERLTEAVALAEAFRAARVAQRGVAGAALSLALLPLGLLAFARAARNGYRSAS